MRQGHRTGALAAIIVASVAFAVNASPLVTGRSPSASVSSQISLFHQALIYAKDGSRKLVDGRWNLSQSEAKLGITLSAEETKQLMACTGQIVCEKPGRPWPWRRFDEPQEPMTATGVSVLRPDLLVTAQHVFFRGKKSVVSFDRCSFRSYLHRKSAIPILVERDQRRGYALNNEDFAVLRLKRELKDCNSLAINDSDSSLPEGEEIFSVTGQQRHTLNKLSRSEPVIAKGAIRTVFSGFYGGPPFYHAEIDLDEGGSGGAVFALKDGRPVADGQGRLILRGILVGHGLNARSGKPYSEERNYTIIIGLQSEFRDLVQGKANKPAAVEPARCFPGEAAKISVIAEPVPPPQSEPLAPLLQQDACGPEATGTANTTCTELAKELAALAKEIATLAASPRPATSRRAKEFRLRNATSCPICFTYSRCNDYGCWDEAVRASGKSTLFAGVGVRAPVIKNPQFCHSGGALPVAGLPPSTPALAHINFPGAQSPPPLPSRKPAQAPTADSRDHPVEPEAVFLAAKEKAKREGVHTLTAEDIRGLSLQQIRELRGY